MSTDLFVTLVFVVLSLLVAWLGLGMRRSADGGVNNGSQPYTESDRRVWTDASRYLGTALIRLGVGSAALALALHGLSAPRGGQLSEQLVFAVDGVVVLVGLMVLLVLHWLYARERWHFYRMTERADEAWPAVDPAAEDHAAEEPSVED